MLKSAFLPIWNFPWILKALLLRIWKQENREILYFCYIKHYEEMKRFLIALLPAFFLLSCTEGGKIDPENPENPDTPQTPEVVSDWQPVGASAGSLTRDNITVAFPSGTFNDNETVGITVEKTGDIAGEAEKSPFYHVTMPEAGSAKPLTVSIKYDGDASKVRAALKTQYYSISDCRTLEPVLLVDSEFKDGAFRITLPETFSCEDQKAWFSVGLVDADDADDDTGTRAAGTEWTRGWNLWPSQRAKYKEYRKKINAFLDEWIPTAQGRLQARGFDIPPIYYELQDLDDDTWGAFVQPTMFKTRGYIQLNAKKYMAAVKAATETDKRVVGAKTTLIHETLHASQTLCYYSLWAFPSKILTMIGYEYTMFTEALAVWSEQFMRDPAEVCGDPASDWECFLPFIKTFYPLGKFPGNQTYQDYGYAMGAFIQYLDKMTSHNDIVRLVQLQKEGYNNVSDIFDKFLDEHDLDFFDTESFVEFAEMYCNGELVTDVNYQKINPTPIKCTSSSPVTLTYGRTGTDVYSMGFVLAWLSYEEAGDLLKDYSDYCICFNQSTKGLKTLVYMVVDGYGLVYAGYATEGSPYNLPIIDMLNNSCKRVVTITVKTLMTNEDTSLRSSVLVTFEPLRATVKMNGQTYEGVEIYVYPALIDSQGITFNMILNGDNGRTHSAYVTYDYDPKSISYGFTDGSYCADMDEEDGTIMVSKPDDDHYDLYFSGIGSDKKTILIDGRATIRRYY